MYMYEVLIQVEGVDERSSENIGVVSEFSVSNKEDIITGAEYSVENVDNYHYPKADIKVRRSKT